MPQQPTKRMHKTKAKDATQSCWNALGDLFIFVVRPIMFGADYGVSAHPRSPGWLRWASGIVTRQAGRCHPPTPGPWALLAEERTAAAFVCRWKGLQVLTAMINHPEADIWMQPGKGSTFYSSPHTIYSRQLLVLFPPLHLPALSSWWPLPSTVFLSPRFWLT